MKRLEYVPLHVNLLDRGLRLRERLSGDGCDRVADVAGRVRELLELGGADGRAHSRRRCRRGEIELLHARARMRGPENGRVQHPRQLEIGGVRCLAARPLGAVDARDLAADDRQRAFGPLVENVLLDHDPLLGVAPLDFLLGLDQPRHVAIASSIFG